MTTDRPYRKAMPVAAAIAELRNESGKEFDPRVVETLIDLVEAWDDSDPPTQAPPEA